MAVVLFTCMGLLVPFGAADAAPPETFRQRTSGYFATLFGPAVSDVCPNPKVGDICGEYFLTGVAGHVAGEGALSQVKWVETLSVFTDEGYWQQVGERQAFTPGAVRVEHALGWAQLAVDGAPLCEASDATGWECVPTGDTISLSARLVATGPATVRWTHMWSKGPMSVSGFNYVVRARNVTADLRVNGVPVELMAPCPGSIGHLVDGSFGHSRVPMDLLMRLASAQQVAAAGAGASVTEVYRSDSAFAEWEDGSLWATREWMNGEAFVLVCDEATCTDQGALTVAADLGSATLTATLDGHLVTATWTGSGRTQKGSTFLRAKIVGWSAQRDRVLDLTRAATATITIDGGVPVPATGQLERYHEVLTFTEL